VDSSNGYCSLELGLVKEYNTEVRVSIWDVDAGLSNHVKNKFSYSPLSIYFKHFNYIVDYCVYLKQFVLFVEINDTPNSCPS
jgi:hypothetical protein